MTQFRWGMLFPLPKSKPVAGKEYERGVARLESYLHVHPSQFDCLRQSRSTINDGDNGRILN